jgi:hypothetical protein
MDKVSLQFWSTTEIMKSVSLQLVRGRSAWWPKRHHTINKNVDSTWEYIKIQWLYFVITYSWTTYHK